MVDVAETLGIKLNASKREWDKLFESRCWDDLVRYIDKRIEDCRDNLESAVTNGDSAEALRINGKLQALRDLLATPKMIAELLPATEEEKDNG